MSELRDYFRYLTTSDRERQWGLYVLGAGYQYIPPDHPYPPTGHEYSHIFAWQAGRTLQEYQLLLITTGAGEFETEQTGVVPVSAGTAIILFPGVWHRYRPAKGIGWNVYWVAFHGENVDRLRTFRFLDPANPILNLGMDVDFLRLFTVMLDRIRGQQIGFEQLIASDVSMIIASLLARVRSLHASDYHTDIVNQLKIEMEKPFSVLPKIELVASQLKISPSMVYRLFKEHTGLSPYQYHLQVKIQHAKEMLSGPTVSVRTVASSLGFRNPYHFSKLFKRRTGFSPSEWRKMRGRS
jgi:AraC-like DNA-binding protein